MLEINNLSREFNRGRFYNKTKFRALNDISFNVQRSEFVAILGKNGSGKSTLMKTLCGILKATKGDVEYFGKNVFKKRKEIIPEIGVFFSSKPSFIVELTVEDNLNFFSSIYKIDVEIYKERFAFIDKHLLISPFLKIPYRKLSFGQRIKAELTSILLHAPKLIYLDEPTIGLDVIAKKGLFEILNYYKEKHSTSVVLISHDMEYIDSYCDRVILLDNGEVIEDMNIKNIRTGNVFEGFLRVEYEKIINFKLANEILDLAILDKENANIFKVKIKDEKALISNIIDSFSIISISKKTEFNYLEYINED